MSSSLPIKFEGFELEVIENVGELDRSNEVGGILQGKILKWELANRDNGDGGIITKTAFIGEDAGRLLFSGVDATNFCFDTDPTGARHRITRVSNRGGVMAGMILEPNQFGPGIKYKIGLAVRAKIVPGISHVAGRECSNSLVQTFTPCVINILTSERDSLALAFSPQIERGFDHEFNINLTTETDTIDVSSRFPAQSIRIFFSLTGKLIKFEKAILSKKVF